MDAYARLPSGPAIFEVKSNTKDNERSQIRHAISQLYEYRYLHDLGDATLWIVLSNPPFVTWMTDYLRGDRSIHVLWAEENELAGPDLTLLTQSRLT